MYADSVSAAMKTTIQECERRRKIQLAFNKQHNITPRTIKKVVQSGMEELSQEDARELVLSVAGQSEEEYAFSDVVSKLEQEMEFAARNLQFEKAAFIRDKIKEIKNSVKI
jgi:excinuclease ABC subunit B